MKANEGGRARRPWILSPEPAREGRLLLHISACLGIAILMLFLFGPGVVIVRRGFQGISPGTIADRDITAGKDVVYIDADATRLRMDAEERLVLPLFQLDSGISSRIIARYNDFMGSFRELSGQEIAPSTALLMLQSRFPGTVSTETLSALSSSSLKSQALVYAEDILGTVVSSGIFSLPSEGLARFNQDYFELERLVNDKPEIEQRTRASMVSIRDVPSLVRQEANKRHLSPALASIVTGLVTGFAQENAFFDESASMARLRRVSLKVLPVTRAVGRNELIIRKGEMVDDAAWSRLQSVRAAVSRSDIGLSLRSLGLLLSATVMGLLFMRLREAEGHRPPVVPILLGSYGALIFYVLVLVAGRSVERELFFDGAWFIPVALFTGIAAIIGGQRSAFSYAAILGILVASASNMNQYHILFVMLAGSFASVMTAGARTRLDLALAAVVQALLQFILAFVLLLNQSLLPGQLLLRSAYLALNGFVSCALILALLPVIEQSFNLSTRFRLLELSDVNAASLKELLTQAPGTYSHSMNVAHLAEAGAEAIGANPLLARVGAYYHDIGKAEQPEYFVENQRGTNKHDEINPRLSATVIRSHVKIGIEKARELNLPEPVVDIVAQHHGDSVIAWFYGKARESDGNIRPEDFSYPGSPPVGKEAGIVMLADSVEASARTLKKPTIPRLDEHVHQIILDKIRSGQLDRCDLTLKELDEVRQAFVRILAGQFHSRIEYPKAKEQE
jgi:putative nucleotidyltransferase with HDIG domain